MADTWPEEHLASSQRRWRSLSEDEWEAIRSQYLAGVSARDLCDRHEIGLSTLRMKARDGGWRRGDVSADPDLFPVAVDAWPAAADYDDDDDEGETVFAVDDWPDMIVTTRRHLRRAIASGRAAEAASWMRLHDRLRANLPPEPGQPTPAPAPPPAPSPSEPDPVIEGVIEVATRIDDIVRRAERAADAGDETPLESLQNEIIALKHLARRLDDAAPGLDTPALDALDALDSLDAVFSGRGLSP